jgi:hypothetical protein
MDSIYLFCGGNRSHINDKSKPLQKFVADKELVLIHYEHIKSYFNKITYIVEENEISLYSEILANLGNNVHIFRANNHTTTLQKLYEVTNIMSEEFASFSYPDIFCGKDFWQISKEQSFTISRVSIKSRFPRIFSDIFTENVKGISNYQAQVPANPHYIFGGKFDFNVKELQSCLSGFDIQNKNLEIDFLDDLALAKTIYAKTVFDDWFNIDSDRDFINMINRYGNSS